MALSTEKVADAATGLSWGGLLFSHVAQIDEVLRFISLAISCVSGLFAALYYLKRISEFKRSDPRA